MIYQKQLKEEFTNNNKNISTKITLKKYQQINKLVDDDLYHNSSNFFKEAIRKQLREQNEITLRNIPYEQQKIEISDYMKSHKKSRCYRNSRSIILRYI